MANSPAPKADPITTYMDRSSACFEDAIAKPLRSAFADIRAIRNYAMLSSAMQEHHGEVVEKLHKIDDDVWNICTSSPHVGRRFQNQAQKVAKKLTPVASAGGKTKSVARREAGKVKAASLVAWRQECAKAPAALKQEGYKGSMKVKPGQAVHNKITELRQSSAAGAASSSGPGPTC